MCGFAGLYTPKITNSSIDQLVILKRMGCAINHRGPDDSGVWYDRNGGIGFSHRRLSILDLSEAGRQPMESYKGRYVIAFNGEIYNHLSLREEIEHQALNIIWKGRSDTETLLAGFELWGVNETIKKATGMFALAVWDRLEKKLKLIRDRCGEKPLYYGWCKGAFLFGSELKALYRHPLFEEEIDRNSLALYLRHNYIPSPYSIWKNIYKVIPGQIATLKHKECELTFETYWSGKNIVERKGIQSTIHSEQEAIVGLEATLQQAVQDQMIADVPVGAFLSGGVDSSTIVALMQSQSSKSVKTFSIGFEQEQYNEAEYAKAVAEHLGTEHTEFYVTPNDVLNVIPRIPKLFDEPFADSSQIPTFLVSELARKHVTVALTGDAADELFCGYNRYTFTHSIWQKIKYLPLPIRNSIASIVLRCPPKVLDYLLYPIKGILPGASSGGVGDKAHKAAKLIGLNSMGELYWHLVSQWKDPSELVIGAQEYETVFTDPARKPECEDAIESMMGIDLLSYMVDDILVKVDRASMGVSLETRVPFLDHAVVEYAWQIPLEYKIKSGVSKWALRQILYRYVPKNLIDRPKVGFGIPLNDWLRGPLRDWAADLLDINRIKADGYFEPSVIQRLWLEHINGVRNWGERLWTILMFQLWLQEYRENVSKT